MFQTLYMVIANSLGGVTKLHYNGDANHQRIFVTPALIVFPNTSGSLKLQDLELCNTDQGVWNT